MQYIGHVYKVRPGKADEYVRRHKTVWPEIEALLRKAGVRSYSIYLWGDTVFGHIAVEDYERLVAEYNSDPIAERWEQELSDILTFPNADPETGWPEQLTEVWSL
ncbi:L-rhamnose mutarotase [Actinobacteria bacterium YIM 96077]|uniref:L-rhamnose mutarotase n=1 Tax=Phytoactinopolyspora halophila TaxID=1981511 RepID=A0A329QSP6_9ACTN|nr:L-rhamnose mutarotase [Phytoactinopolyspora halophila]AYY14947.1 L-rhamnose mutarotase [Actinobacteria bacterium YIM 96077]RAW15404.1 hypothetical protein DPM12_09135 [Phytoactinopolyspora halophila]